MNQSGSIIPVIAETLDIMPTWLKYTLFLCVISAVSLGLFWLGGVKSTLNDALNFITTTLGLPTISWESFVVICFFGVLGMLALYVNRSI